MIYIAPILVDDPTGPQLLEVVQRVNSIVQLLERTYHFELIYIYDYVYFGFAYTLPSGSTLDMSEEVGRTLRASPFVALDSFAGVHESDRSVSSSDWLRQVIAPRAVTNIETRIWIVDTGLAVSSSYNVDETVSGSFLRFSKPPRRPQLPDKGYVDEVGHGTMIASIIAPKVGSTVPPGLASGVQLGILNVARKNLSSREYDSIINPADAIAAMNYIGETVTKEGVGRRNIVNLSLGMDRVDPAIDMAVVGLASRGARVVVAAGQDGRPASQVSPSRVRHPSVFVIAAVDENAEFWSESNFGAPIEYAEPGVGIVVSDHLGRSIRLDGTSFSCAVFSALLVFGAPNADLRVSSPGGSTGVWFR